MSTPAPPPAEPLPPAPVVPYGGEVTAVDPAAVSAPISTRGVAKSVGRAAVAIGIRAIIVLVLRAVIRALFRR